MCTNSMSMSFEDYLRDTYQDISEAEVCALAEIYHDISCELTARIATDLIDGPKISSQFHRALTGRYRICRKLHDDAEYWEDCNWDFLDFSAHLAHEPCIIAAALAIRPSERGDWELVEAWSWVYRHALMLDVGLAEFDGWCAHQTPDASHATVLDELMRSGRIAALSNEETPTIFDPANDNA